MASIRYYNQAGPFWDFIADLEAQGSQHPLLSQFNQRERGPQGPNMAAPWAWAFGDRHPPPPPPPPPFGFNADTTTQEAANDSQPEASRDASATPAADHDMPPRSRSRSPAGAEERTREGSHGHHHHRGRHGRGGCFNRGRGGFDPRSGRRGWGRHGGFGSGGPFNMNALAAFFNEQFLGRDRNNADDAGLQGHDEDFKPQVDVFDTEASYVLHVSLPGARKEDVNVSWDADKSEVSITGVVHRPGDEDFLKTLALDERQVGAFERKVRLGSRANPAQVDSDAISARMDAGILTIDIPKEDKDYVDVKKVDIE